MEEGTVTLVGATTENPYFEVNSALISRAQVYELRALRRGRRRAAAARDRARRVRLDRVDDDAIAFLAARSGGDARAALNAIELASRPPGRPASRVTVAEAEDALQRKAVLYDKGGDQHYDYISAWIKSTRGSDPDASLYYLAAMLEGGEDARFIARRMVILASEDIGNADPQALAVAVAAAQAVEHVGLPEGAYALAPGGDLPSLAPKSNAAARRSARPRAEIDDHGGRRRRRRCGPPPIRGAQARAGASATSTRTTRRGTSTTRSTSRGARGPPLLRARATGSRRCASGWRRSGRPAARRP